MNRKDYVIYNRRYSPVLLFLLGLLLISNSSAQNLAEQKSGPVPGRFVVKLSTKASPLAISQALTTDAKMEQLLNPAESKNIVGADEWDRVYLVTTTETDLDAQSLTARIGATNIEFIEPDYYLEFYDLPTDPLYSDQWYLNNSGQDYLAITTLPGVGNDKLELTSGTAGIDVNYTSFLNSPPTDTTEILVAVIDGGIDITHPEMIGRIWRNPDEISFNGIDDDHNGMVDDTMGWDLSGDIPDILNITPDNDPTDFDGHGSHIAGIIAANADGYGTVGITPWIKLLPVKTRPNATSSIGAAGIVYSVLSGARVINISWGTPFESLILREATNFARQNSVFIAFAAGNSGDNQRVYPASYDSSFAVAASTSDGFLTSFSTYGAHVDLTAPGLDILSIRAAGSDLYAEGGEPGVHIVSGEADDSLYFLANGTSMAAPMVAGAAALLLSFRPDLSLNELEDILRAGADDILDPFNLGESYPGPDTIGGYGLLNIQSSMNYLFRGGLHFVTPTLNQRYQSDVEIRIAADGGYTGSWQLEYRTDELPESWLLLASGVSLPSDSSAALFDLPALNGKVHLKLTDQFGNESLNSFYYVTEEMFVVTTPAPNEEFKYDLNIIGSVFGPAYDSLAVYYRDGNLIETRIFGSTREFFNELIETWNISGVLPGMYDLILYKYNSDQTIEISIPIDVLTSYTAGWPQLLTGRGGFTPATADLNNDGFKELIVGTANGLDVFGYDGQMLAGFPVLPDENVQGTPAVYDIDRDGAAEVIVTSETGLHAFNYDGSYVAGFPIANPTGRIHPGWPLPVVTKLGADADSAIIFAATNAVSYAYEFNGDSYFYSLEGRYAELSPIPGTPFYNSSVDISSSDLDGNGTIEAVISYSGSVATSGVSVLKARNGQPAFGQPTALLISTKRVWGTLLADLDGDSLMEIVTNADNESGDHTIFVYTKGREILDGWPVVLEGTDGWLGSPATVADLDLDGIPEIIISVYEFDIGSVYIFRADGTPYLNREGRPAGEVFFEAVTFGPPIVANLLDDAHPEIILRSGYILPGTGPERVHILDYTGRPLPGWPIATATGASSTFSTPYAPLVDDIDNDGLVELILIGEGRLLFVWDFTAAVDGGRNTSRLYQDNLNSSLYIPPAERITNVNTNQGGQQ